MAEKTSAKSRLSRWLGAPRSWPDPERNSRARDAGDVTASDDHERLKQVRAIENRIQALNALCAEYTRITGYDTAAAGETGPDDISRQRRNEISDREFAHADVENEKEVVRALEESVTRAAQALEILGRQRRAYALLTGAKRGGAQRMSRSGGDVSSLRFFTGPHAEAGAASYVVGLLTAAAFMALAAGPGWLGFIVGFLPMSLLTSWAVASHA